MPVTAVIGTQWGDEGKGKIVDLLAQDADMVIRFNGGNNAGHTIENEHTKDMPEGVAKLHIVPAGVFNSKTLNVIGAGTAVHIPTLAREISELRSGGLSVDNLIISKKAHLVMPWHVLLDEAEELKRSPRNKIGTTKRGMGPVFSAKHARKGFRAGDLLKADFRDRFFDQYNEYELMLQILYRHWDIPNPSSMYREFMEYAEQIRGLIHNAENEIDAYLNGGSNILLEGAQAVLLDIDHGTYPFCTSSACTIAAASQGSGIPANRIDERIGVVKAYSTRVGPGAFPTRLEGAMDNKLREWGREYGATTGRPRACGWLDLPLLSYANRLNDFTSIAVTKIDILDNLQQFYVGVGYKNCSEHEQVVCEDASCGLEEDSQAALRLVDGWNSDITGVTKYSRLPKKARAYVRSIEDAMSTKARFISVGPHRDQTIVR